MKRISDILKRADRRTKKSVLPDLEKMPGPDKLSFLTIKDKAAAFMAALDSGAGEEVFWRSFYELFFAVTAERKRNKKKIHPSSFSKDCLRRLYYEFTDVEETDEHIHSPRIQRIFDVGHFWHVYIQTKLLSSGKLLQMEVPVRHRRLMIDGRADGLLEFSKTKVLLEIKTMHSIGFNRLKGPLEDHIYQASIYASILEVDEILFLYINKDTSDLKEFLVKRNQEYFNDLVAGVEELKHSVKNSIVPERICSSAYCKRAESCNYKTHCFNETE